MNPSLKAIVERCELAYSVKQDDYYIGKIDENDRLLPIIRELCATLSDCIEGHEGTIGPEFWELPLGLSLTKRLAGLEREGK